MFRHQGKTRTFSHNLKIASLLSFVAGLVNVVGFLAVQRLTTNVTGHFAFFMGEVSRLNYWQGFIYLLYIFFFLLGAFSSNFLIELMSRTDDHYIYVIPASIECAILFTIGFSGTHLIQLHPDLVTFNLLFAMGLQNSLVTTISKAAVRTTHLTGLFTDLGIELSQLFFYKAPEHRKKLFSSIKLRLTIISFFFIGGIVGDIIYVKVKLYALIFAAMILSLGLVYDNIKFKLILLQRKLKSN
jgi:uncharacterized membrane protein YoaK (UPF0700 family)